MNILLLCPYPPYPPRSGGALRIYNLLLGLAHRHDVCCLTFAPDARAALALEPLHTICRLLTVYGPPPRSLARRAWTTCLSRQPDIALRNASPAYAAVLEQVLATQRFAIVQAESIEMAGYGLLAAASGARLVLDEFNAEYVLQRRAAFTDLRRAWQARLRRPRPLVAGVYSLIQWQKLARYEYGLLRRYQHVLAVSEEDRQALRRLFRHSRTDHAPHAPISIIPNGVDTAYFQPQPDTTHQKYSTIVFTGTLDFRPNVDAVLWFVQEVLPLIRARHPAARFVVVGRSPAPVVRALHNGTTVEIAPDVADVRPYIASAAAYVIPMRMGGGIRLKLLEALAMQAPVVSTTMGAEGVPELRNGEHLALADTPADFAAAVLRLLDDPAAGRRMGAAGRALVTARYEWQVIVPRLEEIYSMNMQDGELTHTEPA